MGIRMGRVLALLLLVIPVLACSGLPASASVGPSPSQADVTPKPSGSFLTIEAARAAYAAVADPYNIAIDRAEEQYGRRTSLEDHQRYWALIAQADGQFIEGLKKIAFPPEVQADAATLIKADESFQQRALAASRARSLAEVISLSAAANDAADVVADRAGILREGLGLEPNS